MTPTWAQRQAELLRDCIVSPDVFQHMVDRLRDFAVPYQRVLEAGASQRNVPLYLAGLLSPLDRKNAEQIGDCSRATGLIQPVHDEVMQGFVDGLQLGLHATCPAQDGY
jgi:hypothetical protein